MAFVALPGPTRALTARMAAKAFSGRPSFVLVPVMSSLARLALALLALVTSTQAAGEIRIPVLLYHRFHPSTAASTTITVGTFEAQLRELKARGYTIVPARDLVEYLQGRRRELPARAVVVTVDDGHRSVYTELFPIVLRERIPVTLFIYPSAISRADYALTWKQLRTMHASGLVDVQSHTYWHPNFNQERRRLAPAQFARFAREQLERSRAAIEAHLDGRVDMIAWPYGIVDGELEAFAKASGYAAGFTMERRPVGPTEDVLALPRYAVTDADRGAAFLRILTGAAGAAP